MNFKHHFSNRGRVFSFKGKLLSEHIVSMTLSNGYLEMEFYVQDFEAARDIIMSEQSNVLCLEHDEIGQMSAFVEVRDAELRNSIGDVTSLKIKGPTWFKADPALAEPPTAEAPPKESAIRAMDLS